jgi:hypothetical protein
MKTTFRLVGGTDVDPALLDSAPPKRKHSRPSGNVQGIDPSLANRPSATAENGRLREERQEVWRMAEAATRYWRVRLDLHHAIWLAQDMETPEGRAHPAINDEDRYPLVEKWRAAFVRQLLTPAWDAASVAWKQTKLASERKGYYSLDVKPERIERAIADDLAFLAAHPVRQSNSEAMAHRREFKEAMRQRIRDIAASRDLSDEEIRPVLKLKHHEIANFTEKHGVNVDWLLEGKGRIFKKDPIRLSPNMTGNEFAAVVATMPEADQQAIRATVREILQERDQ